MIQGKWYAPEEPVPEAMHAIREQVFGQGGDALDSSSWKALLYFDEVPAGTGRIWWQDGSYWLGEIAVLPEYRGRGLGDLALRLLLYKAQTHYASEVRLRCPANTEGFFARLGLRTVTREDGLTEMRIAGDEILLDSCAACPKTSCARRGK